MEQSARDCGCTVEQLLGEQNTVLSAKELSGAKKYYQDRHFCQMISYGHGTVAVVNPAIEGFVRQYLQDCRYPFSAFDTPHINCLHQEARKYGQSLCFLAEYFLPEPSKQPLPVPDHLQIRLLYEDELLQLYPDKRFPMALGYTRTEPKKDVIAAVGYLGSEIVGVAGASDDCEDDVAGRYRRAAHFSRQGICPGRWSIPLPGKSCGWARCRFTAPPGPTSPPNGPPSAADTGMPGWN